MHVDVRPTAESAAAAAADDIATQLLTAVQARGRASLALSGGMTPREMVRRLSLCDLAWDQIDLLQVDERAAPLGDPARNWSMLRPLVDRVPVERRHPLPVERADGDREYCAELRETLGNPAVLDVAHLGIGADGHTASLIPGDAALDITDREVSWVGEYQGHRRMTLTLPVLRAARHQVWLVAGADKADALATLMSGEGTTPAVQAVTSGATVFADVAAAARLQA